MFRVAYSYTYELRPYLDLLLQMLLLEEILFQVAYSYTYELRPYLDLLLQMFVIISYHNRIFD